MSDAEDRDVARATTEEERRKLDGLLGFAGGVIAAREKVQMSMGTGLGVFHEGVFAGLPGVDLDAEDGAWLRLARLRESAPMPPAEHVAEFMSSKGSDPERLPELLPAISREVTIEEASDLAEAGLLRPENVLAIVEKGVELENQVRVTLLAEDCAEMRRDFETWRAGPWSDWARIETPVRRSIRLYKSLFQIHSAIHAAESVPPELVWGIGVARWRTTNETIDMPLIEQLVDIEVEGSGAIAIRPRDLQPTLSLRPYLEIEVPGTAKLQRQLQDALATSLGSEEEFSPFHPSGWEHIFATAEAQLSESAYHLTRAEIVEREEGATLPAPARDLLVSSAWAIFGRARSGAARAQDIEALRREAARPEIDLPRSITGFAAPAPDKPQDETDDFGLSLAVLRAGEGAGGWREPSASPGASFNSGHGKGGRSQGDAGEGRRVHFFPLPFNEEQAKIADLLDAPGNHVTTVTGPPGTGKTHTIANIISHFMATGKRVLVTARTAEAISAVRDKLPESLRPLVISSVGTDRESANQLREAVSQLSDEVVAMDVEDAKQSARHLEAQIVACDDEAAEADAALAALARENLLPLEWRGEEYAAMDLVEILEAEAGAHAWFSDRPEKAAPAQLDVVLARLRATLPRLAPDIAYAAAGADLPAPSDLPSTAELIAAHERERAWNVRKIPDYSGAPVMARDTGDADALAQGLLDELEACAESVAALTRYQVQIATCVATADERDGIGVAVFQQVRTFMSGFRDLEAAARVRFELGRAGLEDFCAAAERGAAGQKPLSLSGSLFNSALKAAVGGASVAEKPAEGAEDWRVVHAAATLHGERYRIAETLEPLIARKYLPPLPRECWDLALYLKDRQVEIAEAIALGARLSDLRARLAPVFPYGLDLDALCRDLSLERAIWALRANLPDGYQQPAALDRLDALAGNGELSVLATLAELRRKIGAEDLDGNDIVAVRGELTRELERLDGLRPDLEQLSRDLAELAQAGAPGWAERLRADPLHALDLIPETWREAWSWALMRARVERIVALGNGDAHRKGKAEALRRRRRLFEELIRTRTLIGLNRRMTSSVRRALQAFTQAVARIGKGTGRTAPRFRAAAQEAAREASSAAPVWIMPEYKIPEQLPAKMGDFDLVILDEASQSDITALAALARGKSILVVGDEEQVSPSNVGITVQKMNALRAEFLSGLPNASLIDENTSIFEIAMRMHPDTHVVLREHFRCVAPIIQFSTQFYANRLVPLRVPKASERFDPPLVDVYIPGATRQGKTNKSEARYIVDEIARLIADPAHAHRDIGVISLIGNEQAAKIERMLIEDARIGPEKIAERRIICGDARTLQGQERSVVLLSMVATPGQAHAQTGKTAQQRMNVAMSRAQDRLYLVRSVGLDDLGNPADIKVKVIKHFHDPMPEGRAELGTDLLDRCQSGFEREVMNRLLDAGYRARPQVKAGAFSIDIVVEGAEDRRLAIELDGDAYHGPDVWEKDMVRQAALERAGWTFWRVFGSQWNAAKAHWWQNLCETLTRMEIAPLGAEARDERFTEHRLIDPHAVGDMAAEAAEAAPESTPQGDELAAGHGLEEHAAPAQAEPAPTSAAPGAPGPASPSAPVADASDRETSPRPRHEAPRRARQSALPIDLEGDLFSRIPESANGAPAGSDAPEVSAGVDDRGALVRVGSTVKVEKLSGGGRKMHFTIVEQGHDPEAGFVGCHTPLGEALIDAAVGDEVEYRTGAYLHEVRVIEVA